ncbi:MAG TPA: hypothetical protein PLV43_06495 [Aequorivita sp.]|nr:hypothetical protein [Aequorivita sp.]
MQTNILETGEFINWLGDLGAEMARTSEGGFQGNEFLNFSDEIIGAFKGVGGFPKAAKSEALATTPEDVETIWQLQEQKIVKAGVAPLLAKGIVSNLKGIHCLLAHSQQRKIQ